jgi:hypothetical protein
VELDLSIISPLEKRVETEGTNNNNRYTKVKERQLQVCGAKTDPLHKAGG